MNQDILRKSIYVHKEIKEDEANGSKARWDKKEILDKKVIYEGDTLDNFVISKDAKCSISDFSLNGKSLKITTSTDIENVSPRPLIALHYLLKDHDLTKYNRISMDIYIKAEGYHAFYFQFSLGSLLDSPSHNPVLYENKWNHISWEIDDITRDDIKEIIINPWLMGTPPEALSPYEIYLDNITLEKVIPDYVKGWDIEDRIAYSHVGYLTKYDKVAITSKSNAKEFSLYDDKGNIVYTNKVEIIHNFNQDYEILDFTSFNKCGNYKIVINNISTPYFVISEDAYDETIWKSLNFLRLLRCGEDIAGVHSACHLNCRTYNEKGDSVPNFGGWHDAGDVSQFEIPTAEMTDALISLALKEKDHDYMLYERLKEEAKVGANWLLRTRFGDGNRALAVTYSIWRKNVLDVNNKTVYTNPAENGPFENFLSAAALAKAYNLFLDEDETFAKWCKRSAIEDFKFAKEGYEQGLYSKRWGPSIPSQTLGEASYAAIELYKITNDYSYLDIAIKYADIVMACQEKGEEDLDYPLQGFFYEDVNHEYLLTYEHRGHEESAVKGIVSLCEILPNHPNCPKWKECLMLYANYIKNSMFVSNPYNLVPGHIYIEGKINYDRFTIPSNYASTKEEGLAILEKQKLSGLKVGKRSYLRIFPIAVQRRGFHATLLSKTKGISAIGKLFNDEELLNIAKNQLEWILGKNPFASSTMYGVGHNYQPLYVAFSSQMVGSLPVGIMTKKDDDMPFWPVRTNAVYKEIWGHTTGKYLSVLVDIL